MAVADLLDVRPEIADAIQTGRPVVALESTLIAHGLPWPLNLDTASAAEAAIRGEGAVPATIAVWHGRPTVGLNAEELETLAQSHDVLKAARRDLATAIVQKRTAATTVSGTMFLAHSAGIRVLATGGIGGVHRGAEGSWDISADLVELSRTPVAVVCAGAKSILDVPRTLELLETLGVPVIGYGTGEFPAFYLRSSGLPVPARADTPEQAAAIIGAHRNLNGAGVVLAQPVLDDVALEPAEFEAALRQAESQAAAAGIRGKEVTPYLLAHLAEITQGKTLRANMALIVANAQLAARLAAALSSHIP
ncbi:MAG TPA: pseudouridine-5'-phosphate glycosidase [Gemmataceae bacterium]|nr:pseudouridine-5'-phosphate glycosidase [Gemmataceae bacterium]